MVPSFGIACHLTRGQQTYPSMGTFRKRLKAFLFDTDTKKADVVNLSSVKTV